MSYPRSSPSAQAPEINLDDDAEILGYDENRLPHDVNNDDKVRLHHERSDDNDGVLVEVTTGSPTTLTTTRAVRREVTAR